MWAQPHTPFDTSLGTTKNSVRTKEGKIKAGIFQQSGGVTMLTEYIGNIGAVEAGQIIVVVGKTVDAASRLDLNLRASKCDEDDVILNVSVRFHDNCIVRNTWRDGEWQQEERNESLDDTMVDHPNPVVAGEIFKFYILIGDQKFHIAVNNQSYCTYAYRLPVELIRTIQLKYDLQFVTQIDQRSAFPFPFPPVQFDDPRNVFSNDYPRPFKNGHIIVITAIPYGNPKGWFLIRFTEGASKRQALHFSARFDPHFVVVRTNMSENSVYGVEERFGEFPFVVDQQFKLAIALTEKEFRFAIDGEYFASFSYRMPNVLERLNGLKISTSYGMYMEVNSVDHMELDTDDCYGFESYSHPNVGIS